MWSGLRGWGAEVGLCRGWSGCGRVEGGGIWCV